MTYQFDLALCGHLCDECSEPLALAEVWLVQPRQVENSLVRAVEDPKTSFEFLSSEAAETLKSQILAWGRSDADGKLSLELADERYQGGPFEVVLTFTSVPHQKRQEGRRSVHVHLTTLQPRWQQGNDQSFSAGWRYCLPVRQWCAIRARFGAWVICGKVLDEASGQGLAGLEVEAFDTDIIQDDALGRSAPTGADGHFRIDYATEDFQRTPFSPLINFEIFPGPDLYFRVSAAGGVLLNEDRVLGRSPARANARPCTCITLKVPGKDLPQQPDPTTFPYWTGIGDFNLLTDIDGFGPLATGLTKGTPPCSLGGNHRTKLAFYANLPLKGIIPWREPGSATGRLKYRFLVQDLSAGRAPVPLAGALLHRVQVGSRNIAWKVVGDVLQVVQAPIYLSDTDSAPVAPPSGTPGPWSPNPVFTVKVDPDGWVEVSEFAIGGGFGVGGWIIGLASNAIAPAGTAAAGNPGDPVPFSEQLNGKDFRLIFEVARTDGTPLPSYTRVLEKLHVSNHPQVMRLGIMELGSSGVGCIEITNTVSLAYTVDHELIDGWNIEFDSAAFSTFSPGTPVKPYASGSTPRGAVAKPVIALTNPADPAKDWPACSYQVTLTSRRALTNGLMDDQGASTAISFCIDRTPTPTP